MVELTPVWPNAIASSWHFYLEGVSEVLRHTKPQTQTFARMYNELLNGFLTLWEGRIDGVYQGFITTHIERVPFDPTNNPHIPVDSCELVVVHGFAKTGLSKDAMIEAMTHPALVAYAKQARCTHISFFSMRDVKQMSAWERRMADIGITRSYTKFIIPLKEV